jgi:hypothetical protein
MKKPSNLKNIFNRSPRMFIWGLLCLASLLFVLILFYFFINKGDNQKLDIDKSILIEKPTGYSLINGKLFFNNEATARPILIVFDNYVDARPAVGLSRASVVYEVIAEGEITRILGLFEQHDLPDKIGPVRSARTYFLEIAEEWAALFIHAGGSPEALASIRSNKYNIDSLNEVSGDGIYFWRDKSRYAPHNIFTNQENILEAISKKQLETKPNFSSWKFKKEEPKESGNYDQVAVDFSRDADYQVLYQYNKEVLAYERVINYDNESISKNEQIYAKTLVFQFVDYDVIDDYGRLDVNLKTGGNALVFSNGNKEIVYWKKENNRTIFYQQNGEEFAFNPGLIWVSLVFNGIGKVSCFDCLDNLP